MQGSTFQALSNEAMFTKEILGAGATQIRKCNYAKKGVYFQAFTSLSTGLERIGKLCLILDHYIENSGTFPNARFLKNKIGHDLGLLYESSKDVISKRSIQLNFFKNLDREPHQSIVKLLSSFAKGDRYSNIDILIQRNIRPDPIYEWFELVDLPLFEQRVTKKKKEKIARNARVNSEMLDDVAMVRFRSETGSEISNVEEASFRTGIYESVAPYRQLTVLQIIRYWVEIIWELQYQAMALDKQEIPFFSEIFAPFYNQDSYIRTRKTWDTV